MNSKNTNPIACTVNVSLCGIPFPIRTDIDDSTASYLKAHLESDSPEVPECLIHFSDVEGRQLVINTSFIKKLIFVDWIETSATSESESESSSKFDDMDLDCDFEDYPGALRIYFVDEGPPVSHFDVSGLELDTIRCLLGSCPLKEVPMASFRDEDNDLTFVNPRRIVFMEYHDMRMVDDFLERENVDFFYSEDRACDASQAGSALDN